MIVDASVVAAWLLPDEWARRTDDTLEMVVRNGASAPSLLAYEVRNLLCIAERRARIGREDVLPAMSRFRRLNIRLLDYHAHEDAGMFHMVATYGLTTYDAAYLVCARNASRPLATLDKALARAAEAEGVPLALA